MCLKKMTILLQYYRAENRAMAKVLRAKFVISGCVFANFFSVLSTTLADLLGNTLFTSASWKGHGLWLVDFNPCCLFPCFIHVSSTIVSCPHLGTSKERRLFNRRKAGDLTQINIMRHSSSWTTNAFHSTVQSTFFIIVFFTSPLMFHQLHISNPQF